MPDIVEIREKYMLYVLEHGREPESVYTFSRSLDMTEEAFYEVCNSFRQLEGEIWTSWISETCRRISSEEIYAGYSVREKLLSFFFTLVEVLKPSRSFVLKSYEKLSKPLWIRQDPVLNEAKEAFRLFAEELVAEGQETREVEARPVPFIAQKYPDLFWMLCLTTIDFWVNDTSRQFEKTDTLIEKSVNTTMDWIGRNPVDSLMDLGKFLFQNRK